jgi:organic hydroperoxide reductase OsmC/OhrA
VAQHEAEVSWKRRRGEAFVDRRYDRAHTWRFDGGAVVPASSSPHNVRVPFSRPEHVDPEEAFVAAISSCHMLTFLFLAAKRGHVVDAYVDRAVGEVGPNDEGRASVTRVTLRPEIIFSGASVPDDAVVAQLHHEAHQECFIANSVRTVIVVAGSWRHGP